MKILYVITKSEIGGAQTHVLQLAKAMDARGHNVALMAGSGDWLENEVKDLGIHFYKCSHFSNNLLNIFGLFRSWKKIKQVVDDFTPDIIACHSSVASFITRIAVRKKIPTVFTVHGWGFTPGVPIWRKLIALLAEKLVAQYTSKTICVSKHDAQLAIKHGVARKDDLIVIHNGVRSKERLSVGKFNKGSLEIIFVGRLARPKRPEVLVKAFDSVCSNQDMDLRLKIIGDGPDMNRLKSLTQNLSAKKKIEILGSRTPEQVMEILSKTHIFVLPSDWESFPMTILEAMSKGNAVIASNVGGISEMVTKDVGILLENNDHRELELTLKNLTSNPSTIKNMATRAVSKVGKAFSLERMINETETVYKKLV